MEGISRRLGLVALCKRDGFVAPWFGFVLEDTVQFRVHLACCHDSKLLVIWAQVTMLSWGRFHFRRGPNRALETPPDAVPPAVAAARTRALQTSEFPAILVDHEPVETSANVDRERSPRAFNEGNVMVSHAGETLFRARGRAPWTPSASRPSRGNLSLALSIARSPEQTAQAEANFRSLIYAPSTSAGKEALFSTWSGLCDARGELPLPVTEAAMVANAAILRSAGYRSSVAYLYEAKNRHIRSGHQWTPRLQTVLGDCKRAGARGQGEVQRAAEVPMEAWEALILNKGTHPDRAQSPDRGPRGGVLLWVLGTHFLLREVELACIHLDTNCIKLDMVRCLATLKLPVSKTDPLGKGAARTLGCSCKETYRVWSCPVHALEDLVHFQLIALGFSSLSEVPQQSFPLVGRNDEARNFVEKQDMVNELKRHAVKVIYYTNHIHILVEQVTGHTLRRSGIKALARKGCSFSSIQWLARHSSNVTWQYIEEAWGENPLESMRLHDDLAMAEMMTNTLARVSRAEEAVTMLQKGIDEVLAKDGFPCIADEDVKSLIKDEIRRALVPKYLINSHTRVVHAVCPSSTNRTDPKGWTTKCGWSWVLSAGICQPCYDAEDLSSDIRECQKCFER